MRAGAVVGFAEQAQPARPGAVAFDAGRVLAAGPASDVERRYADAATRTVDLPDRVVVPGLVNAHGHLELTAVGPRPYPGSFTGWVRNLLEARPTEPAAIAASVARGVALSAAAGTDAVGDIGGAAAGQDAAWAVLRDAALGGVFFPELIAQAPERTDSELERLAALPADSGPPGAMRLGVSPHAPYSTGPRVYDAAARAAQDRGLAVTTHLAETPDEARFVAEAAGPFRDFLEERGAWNDEVGGAYGGGLSPVRWMEPYLRRAPWLLAHCNYVSDDDIELLGQTRASVAYCPIASEYFGHEKHRYRDMLEAGVNVCLGTDSIVCQPPAPQEKQPLGVLPQMRRLHRRDGTDPGLLLEMATAHGRRALQVDGPLHRLAALRFDPDDPTDALKQAMGRTDPAQAIELSVTRS